MGPRSIHSIYSNSHGHGISIIVHTVKYCFCFVVRWQRSSLPTPYRNTGTGSYSAMVSRWQLSKSWWILKKKTLSESPAKCHKIKQSKMKQNRAYIVWVLLSTAKKQQLCSGSLLLIKIYWDLGMDVWLHLSIFTGIRECNVFTGM